jgi:hypothetical protein
MQQAVRDALIAFTAALSQAQEEANKEAQIAGIAHAKTNVMNYLGRKPSFTRAQLEEVRAMLEREAGTRTIADATAQSPGCPPHQGRSSSRRGDAGTMGSRRGGTQTGLTASRQCLRGVGRISLALLPSPRFDAALVLGFQSPAAHGD